MRIALLSTNYDLGGAAIVTRRLTDALRQAGHDARMVVARPGGASPADSSVCIVDRRRWGAAFLAERAELFLKGTGRRNLFKVSTGRYGVAVERHPFVSEADAVIVNWASQGLLSLDSLERIVATGKPVVYIMHDLWPATALCHLPEGCVGFADGSDCASCPYVRGTRGGRLAAWTARRKREIFAAPNLRLVAVSNWQREQALKSTILPSVYGTGDHPGPRRKITVIPHAFPADLYQPGEKIQPGGKRLVVMAAARLDDPVKDLPAAVDALNTFTWEYPGEAAQTEVVFVGALRDKSELQRLRIPFRHTGPLSQDELRKLYASASVVMSSSKFETMGATLMEGMAAGAIPVTFGDGGQRDIVSDGVNGFIAPVHTPASLAFSLSLAIQTAISGDFTPGFLHNEVVRRFSPPVIASRLLSLLGAE